MARSPIGISLGSSNVKLVMHEGQTIRTITRRLPEDIVNDGKIVAPETLAQFLSGMRRDAHIRQRDCSLVIHPGQLFFRHVTLPAMSVAELKLNLPYEFRDYIDDDPSDYVYDYAVDELTTDATGKPERLEIYAAAVRKSTIEDYSSMLRKAGFKLRYAHPAQMVLSRIVRNRVAKDPQMADSDVVFVDLGGDSIVVQLYHGSKFQALRSIEFGCSEFDSAVASLRNIDRYTASAFVADNFEGVLDTPECEAVSDRICVEVNKVVNFYNFSNRDKDISHMYVYGGGSQIPQLVHALAESVDVPVESAVSLLDLGGVGVRAEGSNAVIGSQFPPQCLLAYGSVLESEAM